jgi:hypothetical protein
MRRLSRAAARGTIAAVDPSTGGQSIPKIVTAGRAQSMSLTLPSPTSDTPSSTPASPRNCSGGYSSPFQAWVLSRPLIVVCRGCPGGLPASRPAQRARQVWGHRTFQSALQTRAPDETMKFRSAKTDGNVTVHGLGDDEDLIINGIGNFRHIPCARRRHLDEDLQRPSLDDERELTDGPHARPAHTIADEVGAGAVLQCGRAY